MEEKISMIHQWLGANAPKILNVSLEKGATSSELDHLEEVIGKQLPEDFRALYGFHNGINEDDNVGSLFYGMSFLSIEEIIDDYGFMKEIEDPAPLSKADSGIDVRNMYNPGWICIGFDGSHTTLRVDLAPAKHGIYGQVIFVDDESGIAFIVARSVDELLDIYIADLQNGLYTLEPDALEDGHDFLIPDESIDIVNWYLTEKWARFK